MKWLVVAQPATRGLFTPLLLLPALVGWEHFEKFGLFAAQMVSCYHVQSQTQESNPSSLGTSAASCWVKYLADDASVIEANNVKVVWRALLHNGLDTIVKLYLPQLRSTALPTPHLIPHTSYKQSWRWSKHIITRYNCYFFVIKNAHKWLLLPGLCLPDNWAGECECAADQSVVNWALI